MKNQFVKEYNRYFVRHFLTLSVIIFLLLTLFFLVGLGLLVRQKTREIKTEQQRKVLSEQYFLEYTLKESVYDLRVMTENQFVRDCLAGKYTDKKIKNYFNGFLTDLFKQKTNYYQYRFLNEQGMEIFRIGRINGNPVISTPGELQDKIGRYYFVETNKLDNGYVYISPFDLNIEHEKIEKPFRPMIRICIPVFDGTNRIGVNVLNYDGTNLMDELREKISHEAGSSYLINKDGYFLDAPDTLLEWGFMFPAKKEFTTAHVFPADFQKIKETADGQFETSRGIYTLATVYPFGGLSPKAGECIDGRAYSWKILSFIPQSEMAFTSFIPLDILLLFYAVALFLGLIFAYFYSNIALGKYQVQQKLVKSEKDLRIANQTKDRFFSILSHDLKNASGAISSYLDLINKNFESFSEEEKKMHLSDVTHAASMQTKLLYEILDWARLQQGKVIFNPEKLFAEALFSEQKELVELSLKSKELVLDFDLDPGVTVFGDKEMVKTILRNLVNNAIKFSYRDNRIVLSGKRRGERTELRVTDFGTGMRAAEQEKLFDLSAKVHQPGTENEEGSGFGLKLVLELVKKNNGSLQVESEPGKGSSFIVILPAGPN